MLVDTVTVAVHQASFVCGERLDGSISPLWRVLQSVVEVEGYSITIGSSQSRLVELLVPTIVRSTVSGESYKPPTAPVDSCVCIGKDCITSGFCVRRSLPVSFSCGTPTVTRRSTVWIRSTDPPNRTAGAVSSHHRSQELRIVLARTVSAVCPV